MSVLYFFFSIFGLIWKEYLLAIVIGYSFLVVVDYIDIDIDITIDIDIMSPFYRFWPLSLSFAEKIFVRISSNKQYIRYGIYVILWFLSDVFFGKNLCWVVRENSSGATKFFSFFFFWSVRLLLLISKCLFCFFLNVYLSSILWCRNFVFLLSSSKISAVFVVVITFVFLFILYTL